MASNNEGKTMGLGAEMDIQIFCGIIYNRILLFLGNMQYLVL